MSAYASMNVTQLLSHRDQISAEILRQTGESAIAPVKAKGAKAKKAKKAKNTGPTALKAYNQKICNDHKDDYDAYCEANKAKGVHLVWMASYRKEHQEDYEAFKVSWAAEHPKEAASDAESADTAETMDAKEGAEAKPKRVLTDEHKAKMKAGREAKAAAKKAEKEQERETAIANGPVSLAPLAPAPVEVAAATADAPKLKQPKKVNKKAKEVAPEPQPEPTPEPEAMAAPEPAEEGENEELPFKHNGVTYIRIGVSKADGNHIWSSSDLWHSKKGVRASYAGELLENGQINEDAEEPNLS